MNPTASKREPQLLKRLPLLQRKERTDTQHAFSVLCISDRLCHTATEHVFVCGIANVNELRPCQQQNKIPYHSGSIEFLTPPHPPTSTHPHPPTHTRPWSVAILAPATFTFGSHEKRVAPDSSSEVESASIPCMEPPAANVRRSCYGIFDEQARCGCSCYRNFDS